MRVHPIWDNYPEVREDLKEVLKVIESHVRVRDQVVESTIKELIHSGGKLLRPAYTLLCSHIGPKQQKDKAIALASALEVLHMATLVHDDVIDESDTRHGIPTIHTRLDNRFAIYSGDYLFCVCFTILSRHANSLAHLEFNARGMEKILLGELDQLNARYKTTVTLKDYLSRISGKTAQLFAVSCYTGSLQSEAPRRLAMNAWNMGHYIGMAFQIMDDILDYKGNCQKLGKPVLADIRQGHYTLPLIYAMKQKPSAFKDLLAKKEDITDEELLHITELVHQYQGVEQAQKLAEQYTKKALKHLNKLPNGEYKGILHELTLKLLKRSV